MPSAQQCVVPGCGEQVSLSDGPADQHAGVDRRLPTVCDAHRSMEAICLPCGGRVRFCHGCQELHPLQHFPSADQVQNVCLAARQRLVEIGLRARDRRRARSLREVIPHALGLRFLLADDYSGMTDASVEVWGSEFFTSLTGRTNTCKAAIAVFYPAAGWLLGLRQAEALVPVTIICVGMLHVLMPYMHQQYYVKPLGDVRAAAARVGLTVSSSFCFLDLIEHLKYEERALRRSSLPWNRHGILLLIILAICLVRGPGLSMLTTAEVCCAYFLLRWKASARGWRSLQQWVDTVASTICSFCLIGRYASDDSADATAFCQIFSHVGFFLILSLGCTRTALEAALVETPLPAMLLLQLPKMTVLLGLFTSHSWCGGTTLSPITICLASAVMLLSFMLHAAFRVFSEKSVMLEHISAFPRPDAPAAGLDVPVAFPVPLDAPPCRRHTLEGRAYLHMLCKMAIASPAGLSYELRERLLYALKEEPETMEGVIRPGCVMLGLTMRFSSWQKLSRAMASLTAHTEWEVTLLDGAQSNVHMNIQRSSYVVRDGVLDLLPSAGLHTPAIFAACPPTLGPGCSALNLRVEGLGGAPYNVLLRTANSYLELEVAEELKHEDNTTTVTVMLPASQPPAGLAWVEVVVNTEDGSIVASNPFPVMFTPLRRLAEQMAECLQAAPQLMDSPNQLAAFLEDVADCLHGQATASPSLLLAVIEFGMAECFTLLATRRALQIADQSGQRLLGTAVKSDSLEMVEMVVDLLDKHRLPVDPCLQAPDAAGYTALHWAAIMGNREILCSLLAEVDQPKEVWRRCRARQCGKTPEEVMEVTYPGFVLDAVALGQWEDLAPLDELAAGGSESPQQGERDTGLHAEMAQSDGRQEEGQALLGCCLVAALKGRSHVARIAISVVYLAAVLHLGWREPLNWMALGVISFILHVVLPYAHREVYLKGLQEARTLAGQQGLCLSKFFSLVGAPDEQRAYRQFSSKRAPRQIVRDSLLLLTGMLLSVGTNLSLLDENWGSQAAVVVPVAVCASLLGTRGFAVGSGYLSLQQLADTGVLLWCFGMQILRLGYARATGDPQQCRIPVAITNSGAMLMMGVAHIGHCLGFTAFQVLVLHTPGGFLVPSDLVLPILVSAVVLPSAAWCVSFVEHIPDPTADAPVIRSCILLNLVLVTTFRLQSTQLSMCAFLRSRAKERKAALSGKAGHATELPGQLHVD